METPLWLLCLLFTAYSSAHPYSTPLPPRITTYTRIRSSLSVPPYPPRQLYASTPLQLITPHYQVLQSRITHTLRPNEIENTSDGSERSAIPIGVVSILIAFGSFLVGVVSLFLYREVQKSRDSQVLEQSHLSTLATPTTAQVEDDSGKSSGPAPSPLVTGNTTTITTKSST